MSTVMRLAVAVLAACLAGGARGAPIRLVSLEADVNPPFVNTANQSSPLGTNLATPTDYTREYPFINHFRMARPWFPSDGVQFNCQTPNTDLAPRCTAARSKLALDARGNVKSLAPGQLARSVIFTGAPADPGIANKVWHLYFDGDGDFDITGVQGDVTRPQPGHYVFRTRATSNATRATDDLMVTVTMTRNNAANYVRNVRLVPPGGICRGNPLQAVSSRSACVPDTEFRPFATFHDRIVFNPAFLDQIKRYRSLRFMDWMKTNNSISRDFATRPLPTHQFWNSDDAFNDTADPANCNMLTRGCKGVPLEVMFALANLMDMDPWFNIPHLATFQDVTNPTTGVTTESYVKQFATMLDTHLEAGRKAYVEYSNEVWNFQFLQSVFAFDQANSCGAAQDEVCPEFLNSAGPDPQPDPGSAFVRFYSKRAQQVFAVFDEVLGADRPDRIRRVMATQAVVPYFTDQILAFGNGAAMADVFAIAPYFGDTLTDFDDSFTPEDDRLFYRDCGQAAVPSPDGLTRRQAFLAAGVDGVFGWLTSAAGAPDLGYGSLRCVMAAVRQQADVAAFYDLPLTSYEGGQHFLLSPVNFFTTDPDEIALNELFDQVNRDPRMTAVYGAYLARWRAATDTDTRNNGVTINKPLLAPEGAMFHHFVNSDSWSPFGRWGAKEFPTQTTSPKFKGLMNYITAQPLATVPEAP